MSNHRKPRGPIGEDLSHITIAPAHRTASPAPTMMAATAETDDGRPRAAAILGTDADANTPPKP